MRKGPFWITQEFYMYFGIIAPALQSENGQQITFFLRIFGTSGNIS